MKYPTYEELRRDPVELMNFAQTCVDYWRGDCGPINPDTGKIYTVEDALNKLESDNVDGCLNDWYWDMYDIHIAEAHHDQMFNDFTIPNKDCKIECRADKEYKSIMHTICVEKKDIKIGHASSIGVYDDTSHCSYNFSAENAKMFIRMLKTLRYTIYGSDPIDALYCTDEDDYLSEIFIIGKEVSILGHLVHLYTC